MGIYFIFIKKKYFNCTTFHQLYRVRHIKCYRAIALKLLIISKNVSDKSFSVREGRHTGPRYFFYWWRRWSYVKVNSPLLNGTMHFFSMTLLPILRRIQRPTTQGHSSHTKYENSRKIETYRIKPLKEVKNK